MSLNILYEDNHCIAVVKPHGVLAQGDETGDPSLMDEVKAFIKERDAKPGNVFLGLVHRLDRPAGGVTLFAKTSKGASRLAQQFQARSVQKRYLAVVEGTPKAPRGVVSHFLTKNEDKNIVRWSAERTRGSQEAETHYAVIKSVNGKSLVEAFPITGRPHQIRAALASLGTPILGDLKYGSKTKLGNAIALFACDLEFGQPVTQERIHLSANPEHESFKL